MRKSFLLNRKLDRSEYTSQSRHILGIDPGSRITGYGIIASDGYRDYYVDCGCLYIKEGPLPDRLRQIFHGIQSVLQKYHPSEIAIEEVFVSRNANTALKLGQARGAAILACAIEHLPVATYAPRLVKKAVVGYGNASKEQVQHMIKNLLKLSKTPPVDAADALAIALCHAHTSTMMKKLETL